MNAILKAQAPPIDLGIPEDARKAVVKDLENVLADTYTLYLKTHHYHWNVTGPMFQTLHVLFEQQYNNLWTAVDEIAERIRSLGHFAPGTYQEFADRTSVEVDKPGKVPEASVMVANLVKGHEAVVRTIRPALARADEAGDDVTVDLLTQRLTFHEKTAWMLRALLE
jgi:starvation-inducible DNA-binding protein